MKTVLLTDATIGETCDNATIGETVTVKLHDENGLPIEVEGEVEEVLID